MLISELNVQIGELKEEYIDCAQCPTEKNCCTGFGYDFTMVLPPSIVDFLGPARIKDLEQERRLLLTRAGLQIEGVCPLYEKGCTVYGQREEMGLSACIQFPLTVVNNIYHPNLQDQTGPGIIVDFRCPQIEQSWDELRIDLEEIARRNQMDIVLSVKENYKIVRRKLDF